MENQEYKIRLKIININRNEPTFYPYTILVNKCSGSCNNINELYAKLYVPVVVIGMNIKVIILMSRTNKTRHIERHETCKHKCRLEARACNDKQRWNDGKWRCEYIELICKGRCDKGFIWNPSTCECEFDKPCYVGEYLD